MRIIKTWLVTIATLLCSITASAYDFEVNGIYYNIISASDLTVEVTSGDNYYSGDVIIQSTVNYSGKTMTVTSIGRSAFNSCTGLTSIAIPEGVTSIGDDTFSGCTNLTHITIPNSMTSIGYAAFYNTNLPVVDNIRYADTWAVEETDYTKDKYTLRDNTTGIADGTFIGCTNLTSITIPESVTSIGEDAFRNCSSLTSITIPESVTSIGSGAFNNCSSLTSITIPEGVTSIESSTFSECTELASINIPDGVTSIGQNAFKNTNLPIENNIRYAGTWAVEVTNSNLTSYTLRDNTTGIADNMFEYRYNMTGITLPNNLRYIGNSVCTGCYSLTSLTIPNSVTSIGAAAFIGCWGVPSVTIPSSVTSIGEVAFTGGGNRTSIVVDANNTVYDSRENCNAIICTETNHLIAGCSTTIIPNSVTSIGEGAFMSCGITSVIIPNGVTRIENATFASSALTSISIPSSVTSIAQRAFASCRYLKTISCRNVVPPTCEVNAFQDVNMGTCALEVPLNSVATYRETSPWSGFNISAIVPQTLVLNDGEVFENEENMIVEEITYVRNFKNTNWQALYVPFEIPVTEEFLADFEVAYINDARQYDHDEDGKKDETVIEGFKIKTGTLEANYPYLIRAREIGAKTITATDAMLYAAEENYIDCSSVFETYTFTGTYKRMSSDELSGYYSLSGGVWRPIAEGASLGAFRFYLKVDSRNGNTTPARAIRMRIIGDDETTDIDELESIDNTEQPTIIYDLQGRRVENTENLKGVYVVNGRKVVF